MPLRVGSGPKATATGGSAETGPKHTIRKGDTLWGIADQVLGSGTRWKEIAALNPGVDPKKLRIGSQLQLPPAAQTASPTSPGWGARGATPRPQPGASPSTTPSERARSTQPQPAAQPTTPATERAAGTPLPAARTPSSTASVDVGGPLSSDGGTPSGDGTRLRQLQSVAAFKALVGGATIDTTGSGLTITNERLSQAQFQAAVSTVLGSGAQVSANGRYVWSNDGGVSAQLAADFKTAANGLQLDAGGTLQVANGQATATLRESLQRVLGDTTIIANNTVVFTNAGLQSAQLDDSLTTRFGPDASLQATFKATADQSGIRSATATAAFKALLGGTTIDTTGTGLTITNNHLSQAQFQAAVSTVLGSGAQLNGNGKFAWTPQSGVSAEVVADFKDAAGALQLNAGGTLTVANGQATATLRESLQRVLGDSTVIANNTVVFTNAGFQSAQLDDSLITRFGPDASLQATFKATVDQSGVRTATATAAFKALLGGTTIDTSGSGLTITNNRLTQAQFQAAVSTLLGPGAQVSANGKFVLSRDSGVSGELGADFKTAVRELELSAGGTLSVANGQTTATLRESVKRVLGDSALIANNTVVFSNTGFQSAQLDDSLTTRFGQGGSLKATFKATVTQQGLAEAAIGVAALTRLKQLGQGGAIDVKVDGTVLIKDNRVDRAEVSALLTAMSGQTVNLSLQGKLLFADGHSSTTFATQLAAAWGNTTLNANGTLKVVDGKPEAVGQLSAMFGGARLRSGANLAVTGVDSGTLNLSLTRHGDRATIDASGGLVLDRGHLTGANFTTNLVTAGTTPSQVVLSGQFTAGEGQRAASVDAGLRSGQFDGSLGVAGLTSVERYQPTASDPARAQLAARGGVWSARSASFDLSGGAGLQVPLQVGPVQVQLGFQGDASASHTVQTLTLHPTEADALASPSSLVLRSPRSVDDVLKMQPREQVSESGNQAVGLGGSLTVGYGVGPAALSVDSSMYYQVTGHMSRDIERLEGDAVRVRFRVGRGTTDVKAISASVGLRAPGLGLPSELAQQAGPMLEKVGQAGLSAAWTRMKENETVFDATLDLSTEQGRAAMQHLLANDLSEAQFWAGYQNSGVSLNASVATTLTAQSKETGFNVGPLERQRVSRWLDEERRISTPDRFSIVSAVDRRVVARPMLPWNATTTSQVRFVHETAAQRAALPDASTAPAGVPGAARIPPPEAPPPLTLGDSRVLLGVKVRVSDDRTSADDLVEGVDPAISTLQAMGLQPAEYRQLNQLRHATNAGLAPAGRGGFGATTVDVEGFVSPQGVGRIAAGPDGQTPPTTTDFENAYVEAEGTTHKDAAVLSPQGVRTAIEKTLGARLVPAEAGAYDVVREGQTLGTLSGSDLYKLQRALLERRPSDAQDGVEVHARLGTWASGRAPDPLLRIDADQWRRTSMVAKKAHRFGQRMTKVGQLYAANVPPAREPAESDAAFQARTDAWRRQSLYDHPEQYYQQMDALLHDVIGVDQTGSTGALALLKMAGPDAITARAQVKLSPEAMRGVIEAGRANVQRFGAVQLLAEQGARLVNGKLVISPAPADPALVTAAAKQLFGASVRARQSGDGLSFEGLSFPSDSYRTAVTELVGGLAVQDGQLTPPQSWSASHTRQVLRQVFGRSATVEQGRLVFDNRDYGLVNFSDALGTAFGPDAFGAHAPGEPPPRFPTLTPVGAQGPAQTWVFPEEQLVVRHEGSDASWGSTFGQLAGMDEPATGQPGVNEWLLR